VCIFNAHVQKATARKSTVSVSKLADSALQSANAPTVRMMLGLRPLNVGGTKCLRLAREPSTVAAHVNAISASSITVCAMPRAYLVTHATVFA